MARIRKIQSSFTAGELTPRLLGRSDLAKYQVGLQRLLNFIVSPYGCIYRRPGTKYITSSMSTTKNANKLVRFEYSNSQAYILEFTTTKIRFYKDQGVILQGRDLTNGTFTSGITGWTSASSGTGAIAHDAGNGRLSLTSTGAGNEARAVADVLANFGVGTYTVTVDVYTNSVTYKVGTASNTSDIATGTLTAGLAKTFTFTPTTNGNVYITFQSTANVGLDNISINSPAYEINFSCTDVTALRFAQSYNTLYIVRGDASPQTLTRLGHDNWVLEDMVFEEPPYLDANADESITITPSGTTGSITVTASSAIFASTDVGRAIRYKSGPDKEQVQTYEGTGAQTYFDIPFYPQTSDDLVVNFVENTGARTSKTYTAGVPGAGQFTITSGQVRTGDTATTSQLVEIAPKNAGSGEWGWMTITGYTSTTQVTATVEYTLGGTNASSDWRLGAWSDTTGYPTVVALHEQRLWFASTTEQPQTFWGSQIGNYTNFQPDDVLRKGSVDNETSVSFTIGDSKAQTIQWMASKGSLLLGTSNSIRSARGSNGSITASNISIRKEADVSCEFAEVAETANEVIFIERLGKRVYSIFYSFEIDGYAIDDLLLFSEHLGKESKLTNVVYQDENKLLWATRDDGTLLSCTYIRSQEVKGWARHELGGTNVSVNSIAVIPGSTYSELWLLVGRTINSAATQYVEVLSEDFFNADKEDAVFLDSSLTYSGSAASTVTGLSHVNGESISILANGAVHPNETVSGGSVTLDYAITKGTFGFNYTSELETVGIEGGSVIGTAQSAISKILELGIKFYESIGCKVGYSSSNLDTIPFRSASDSMNTSPSLYSGYKKIKFPGGYHDEYKCFVRQDQPLPLTILNLVFLATVSDS